MPVAVLAVVVVIILVIIVTVAPHLHAVEDRSQDTGICGLEQADTVLDDLPVRFARPDDDEDRRRRASTGSPYP